MRDQELIGLYEAYQQVHKLQEEETGAGPRLQDPYDVRDAEGGPKGGGKIKGPKKRKNILKVSKELMSSYDNWVGQLISDGYDLSNWTDEGLFEYYEQLCEESLEKGQSPTPGGMIKPKKPVTSAIPPKPPKGTPVNTGYKESYDIVFEYLISEGYADTNENALVIMANMSEVWKEEIINEAATDQSDKQIEKGVKTTYKAGNVLDNLHQGRSKGLNKLPRDEREEKAKRMRGRLKTRRDDLFGERNKREDETRAEMKRKYGL